MLSYFNVCINMACGLLLSSFLLRQLGDVDYGVYQTMSSFANYLVLLEFGTGTVLARNLSAARARIDSIETINRNISTIWTVMSVLALAIAAVSSVFYLLIDTVYAKSLTPEQIVDGKNMFVLMTLFLIASFVSQTLNGIVLAYEHYTFSSAVSIFKILTRTGLLLCLVGGLKKAVAICAVDAVLNGGIAVYTFFYCKLKFLVKINYSEFDKQIFKASLPLCLALFLQTIVNQSNSLVGKFVLGVMSGPNDVTVYSVGLYIFSIFSSLAVIPVSLYVPQVTQDITTGLGGLALTKTLVQPSRLIAIAGGTVLFGFFACGRQFVSIVYGEKYLLAWVIAVVLITPAFLNESVAIVQNVLNVKNKRHVRSFLLMFTTALNILMTIFGIKRFGIIAAAVSTGLSTLLQVIIMGIYYHKAIGIKMGYLYRNIYKGILFFQVVGGGIGFFVGSLVNNVYVAFLLSGCTYVAIAFGGFLLFGKNETEEETIKKILGKVLCR